MYSQQGSARMILTDSEIFRILNYRPLDPARDLRDAIVLNLLITTGIRRNELFHVTQSDIRIDRGTEPWLDIKFGKGGRFRSVPIDVQLFRMIQRMPDFLRPAKRMNLQARKMSYSGMYEMIMAASKRVIGFPVHPHLFRHSIATHWLRRGANIATVQLLLGHSQLSTTALYLHPTADDLRRACDLFSQVQPIQLEFFTEVNHEQRKMHDVR